MIYQSCIKAGDGKQNLQRLKSYKGPIVIFGTGNYGALALHALKKHGIAAACFCDNNESNWGTQFIGHNIISPDELHKSFPSAMVLIASLRFKYMRNQLRNNQRMQILDCDFLFTELDLSGVLASASNERLLWMLDLYLFAIHAEKDAGSLKIKSLDVVVTEKCTLRCKDCSNLMQFYKHPQDSDLHVLLGSLDRFMMNVDELYEARILGGEPFVYKRLDLVIKQLSAYKNCRKISIFTNGTITPKDDILESLQNSKVSLIISDYGKLSRNISGLKILMKEKQIPFIDFTVESWQDCAEITYRKRTSDELAYIFGNCCVNDALTLLQGRLYTCPFAAHAANLKAIPQACDDGIDLLAAHDAPLKEKIRELYSGREYIDACSFCAGRDYGAGKIEAAIQSSFPLPYKKY